MLILVFLKMTAEAAFYCTFAGLLGQIFQVDRGTVLLSIPILALSLMLSYLLRNRKALRFLPLVLPLSIGFLPGASIALGVMLLPLYIYMIILTAKKRYEPEYGSAVSILRLYWKIAIAALIIAALVEFSRINADDWGEFVWLSGENKLLTEETLPLVFITLISLVVLTRTLRHDPSVYQSPRIAVINVLTVIGITGAAFLLSSEWFRDGAVWVLRILATPIIYLLSFLVVGITRLFMWLISLLPYNPNTDYEPATETEEAETRVPWEREEIDVQLPENVERIITVVAILLVILIIVLLFRFFLKRRKAAQAGGRGGAEERSRVEGNGPKKAFSNQGAVFEVRRQYRKYLGYCEKEGVAREIDDTSGDMELKSRRYFRKENVAALREIYLEARYDGTSGREEAKKAKLLVRHLKDPLPEMNSPEKKDEKL